MGHESDKCRRQNDPQGNPDDHQGNPGTASNRLLKANHNDKLEISVGKLEMKLLELNIENEDEQPGDAPDNVHGGDPTAALFERTSQTPGVDESGFPILSDQATPQLQVDEFHEVTAHNDSGTAQTVAPANNAPNAEDDSWNTAPLELYLQTVQGDELQTAQGTESQTAEGDSWNCPSKSDGW
jgi:hypothetical protein